MDPVGLMFKFSFGFSRSWVEPGTLFRTNSQVLEMSIVSPTYSGEQWLPPLNQLHRRRKPGNQGVVVEPLFSQLFWGQCFLQRSFTGKFFVCSRHLRARLFSPELLTLGLVASSPGGRLLCEGDMISISVIRVALSLSCNIHKKPPGLVQISCK